MKNLSKCQEVMTLQQEIYWIISNIKIIINLLALIYQEKRVQIILNKSIQEN